MLKKGDRVKDINTGKTGTVRTVDVMVGVELDDCKYSCDLMDGETEYKGWWLHENELVLIPTQTADNTADSAKTTTAIPEEAHATQRKETRFRKCYRIPREYAESMPGDLLNVCGYNSWNDWHSACLRRLMEEYDEKKNAGQTPIQMEEQAEEQAEEQMEKPIFKVGDRVMHNYVKHYIGTVVYIGDNGYVAVDFDNKVFGTDFEIASLGHKRFHGWWLSADSWEHLPNEDTVEKIS